MSSWLDLIRMIMPREHRWMEVVEVTGMFLRTILFSDAFALTTVFALAVLGCGDKDDLGF
jgi:hypothetical protein